MISTSKYIKTYLDPISMISKSIMILKNTLLNQALILYKKKINYANNTK